MSQNFKIQPVANTPEGVSTRAKTHPLGTFRDHDPSKLATLFDECFNLGDVAGGFGKWTQAGDGNQAQVEGPLGRFQLSTLAVINSDSVFRSATRSFAPTLVDELWLYGKFSLSSLASIIFFGFDGALTASELTFRSVAATGQILLRVITPTVSGDFTLPGAIIAPGVFFTLGLHFNPNNGSFVTYFNDVQNTTVSVQSDLSGTVPTANQFAEFGILNGLSDDTANLLVDFVLFSQAR